jgi:hypothetical protein
LLISQSELSKLGTAATASKKQLDTEVQEKLKARKQYEESQHMIQDVRTAVTAAQRANEVAKADMKKIQVSYESKIQTLTEQVENLKTSSSESEENLIKMKQDCDKLSAALSQQAVRHSAELKSREDHWLNEHNRIQKLSETAQMRVGRLEGEKETTITSRRELDILRAKNLELEEKNRRYEQQTKTRFLRDKTNTNSLPLTSHDDLGASMAKVPVTVIPAAPSADALPPSSVAKDPFPSHSTAFRVRSIPTAPTSRPTLGGSSKLHEPGCSMNSYR